MSGAVSYIKYRLKYLVSDFDLGVQICFMSFAICLGFRVEKHLVLGTTNTHSK